MINRMTLQGRLTRDVELRRTQSGKPVASFTVAWSEKYGENERKLFLPCVAWNGTAEMVSKWFSKGSEVLVEGCLVSRKWQDNNGNNRETVEMIVDRVHFCGGKKETQPAGRAVDVYPGPGEFAELEDEECPF